MCLPQFWQTLVTAMGLDSSLVDRPGSGFDIYLWQFYTYLCDLQTDSSDQTGGPTHLSQDVEPECWPWGLIPSQPDMTCQTCFADYIRFLLHVSFLTSLHAWLTSFSSLSDPIRPHYFSEPLNQQRSNVDPVTRELDMGAQREWQRQRLSVLQNEVDSKRVREP